MGSFNISASNQDVDPRLLAWLQAAAAVSPYNVQLTSGYRPGDPRFHGKQKAVDIQLIDPATGKRLENYHNPENFSAYQGFANLVRAAQLQANPEANNLLRWGGYFSGDKNKYGSLDLMHFDVGGDTVGMGGGSWETGLSPGQAKLWNLQTGAGATTPTTPIAETLAPAVTNPIFPEKDPIDFGTIGALASKGMGRMSSPGQVISDPGGGDMSPINVETRDVSVSPGVLAQPWEMGAKQTLRSPRELADIFKVKTNIGQAGLDAPLPTRRF